LPTVAAPRCEFISGLGRGTSARGQPMTAPFVVETGERGGLGVLRCGSHESGARKTGVILES
jgi:hypothetical protein